MLKIGEFAALAQISIRMLRHYDELALLKPQYVDHENGYRYYSLEQLPRLNRILALKDLGLALGEIRLLLEDALTVDEIRGMLKLKQAQLQQHIIDEQARLQRVENRLKYIDLSGHFPENEVVMKSIPAYRVLSLRASAWPGHLFHETWCEIKQLNVRQHINGSMTIYHHSLEFQKTGLRQHIPNAIEIAYLVDDDLDAPVHLTGGRMLTLSEIPAYACVASLVSNKPDAERNQDALWMWQWMAQHHYRLIAPVRELYLKRPDKQPEYLTEMLFPIQEEARYVG